MKTAPLPIGRQAQVELIPLIDVVFLVLVAFVYASFQLAPRTGLPVDLPEATQSESASGPKSLTVTIDAEGVVYVGQQAVVRERLVAALLRARNESGAEHVYVKADRGARLDALVAVMDAVHTAQFADMTLATQLKAPTAPNERGP